MLIFVIMSVARALEANGAPISAANRAGEKASFDLTRNLDKPMGAAQQPSARGALRLPCPRRLVDSSSGTYGLHDRYF